MFSIVLIQSTNTQVEESLELFKELAEKDSILFDQGFNECNLEATESIMSYNLEFYHDVTGVSDKKMVFLKPFGKYLFGCTAIANKKIG